MSGGWGILAGQGMRQYARRTAGNIEDLQDYVHNLAKNSLQMDSSGNVDISGVINIATAGGIFQGTGTFASPTTGLKIWNDAGIGRIAGYNAGVIQTYFGTDGKLYAGGGNVVLDAGGAAFAAGTDGSNRINWKTGGSDMAYIYGNRGGGSPDTSNLTLKAVALASTEWGDIFIQSVAGAQNTELALYAQHGTDASSYAVLSLNGAQAWKATTTGFYPGNQSTRYIADDGTNTTVSAAFKASGDGTFTGGLNVGTATGATAGQINASGTLTTDTGIICDYANVTADTWGITLYQGDGSTARTTYAYLDMSGTDRLRVVGNIAGAGEASWAYINSNAGWNAASSRAVKFDIRQLENKDYDDLLASLREMNVYEYRRKDTPDALEVGVIAEEAPELMLAAGSNKAVNATRSIGFLTAIIKAHDQELRAIKQRLAM